MKNPATERDRGSVGFRAKLMLSMMLVVLVLTLLALYFAQRHLQAQNERSLHDEFQGRLGYLHGAQESRHASVAERCRLMARSVRIRAAIEEDDLEDLYAIARIELRDVLATGRAPNPNSLAVTPRASFVVFLNAKGEVLLEPGTESEFGSWVKQLAVPNLVSEQQSGYFATRSATGEESPVEVITTPVVGPDNSLCGALVLGFPPVEFAAKPGAEIKTGIWIDGKLHLRGLQESERNELAGRIAAAVHAGKNSVDNFIVNFRGVPHLLFYKTLPSGSPKIAAEVSLYSLEAAVAQKWKLRWQIVGAAGSILIAGLLASHFFAGRLSKPVEQLAEDSARHQAGREQAEAALELTEDELRALNAELEKALADLKATQQQVIQQERLRALGQMASGNAHDFNNALMPVMGFAELLLVSPDALDDKKRARGYLEIIGTAAKDAASIVARLREFYRTNENSDVFAPVDLKRLAEQSIALTSPKWKDQAQANGGEIRVVGELSEVPPVAGDESALREVLTNLIFNAVDAMPGGGVITLRTRREAELVVLEVADTGAGMTREVRERCLEPFFSTKGERGTGLGLAMVFGIVQRHRGTIGIESQIGKGTTFLIRLPQGTASAASNGTGPDARPHRPLRVLLVDDEPQVRQVLAAFLETEGHTVQTADHGIDGLRKFMDGAFDLVITDKAMPGMSGDQMAVAIKQFSPKMPVVLLSGFHSASECEEIPGVNVTASKPITLPVLRETIGRAMKSAC